MRKIINFCLTFIVFYVAWKCFPDSIFFKNWTDIIVVQLIMILAGELFSVCIMALLSILVAVFKNTLGAFLYFPVVIFIVAVVLGCVAFNPAILYLCSKYLANFEITGGFVTYLLLSIALCFFNISVENKK